MPRTAKLVDPEYLAALEELADMLPSVLERLASLMARLSRLDAKQNHWRLDREIEKRMR